MSIQIHDTPEAIAGLEDGLYWEIREYSGYGIEQPEGIGTPLPELRESTLYKRGERWYFINYNYGDWTSWERLPLAQAPRRVYGPFPLPSDQ